MNRRVAAAVALAAALPLAGCFDKEIEERNPLGMFMRFIAGDFQIAFAKVTKVETTLEVDIIADVGGLDGTYTITLDNPEGGTFGTFTGTGVVKRGRFVKIVEKDSPELLAAVEALVEATVGHDVTIEKAKAKVSAFQTPGGVEAVFKGKITFSGVVVGGEFDGVKIRGGKITAGETYGGDV
jgi:hypothetical protein